MEAGLQPVAAFAASVGPALLMLTAFALAIAGARAIRRGENRQKGVLMLVCAAVFIANVVILAI